MLRVVSSVAAVLFLLVSAYPASAQRPALVSDEALASGIDGYVQSYVDAGDFAGAVLVAHKGRVVLRKAYGMASLELGVPNAPDTIFNVASLSKPVTATIVLRLQEQGRLSVNDPVSRFVPDYPRGAGITVHHLLTHRSGIPSYNRFADYNEKLQKRLTLAETVAWFKNVPLRFEPGARYEYSNSGYTLLAHIIEIVTGQSYEQVLAEQITGPLRLTRTGNFVEEEVVRGRAPGYEPSAAGLANAQTYDRSAKRGSGALWSTVDDLYAFATAFEGDALLTAASRAEMFRSHFDQGYGYGWGIATRHGRGFVSHDGQAPGYMARIIRVPEEQLTIVFASNIYSGLSNVFNRDLPALAFGQPTSAPKPRPLARGLDPATLDRYVGEYQFPESANALKFRIVRSGGDLRIDFGRGTPQFLTPEGEKQFLMRARYDRLIFEEDAAGTITGVRYQELGFGAENLCRRIS